MDSDGMGIFGLIIGLMVLIVVAYAAIMALSAIVGSASVGGAIFGCGKALLNYGDSFKENVIDSNRDKAA